MNQNLLLNLLISGINLFILIRYTHLLYHKKISPSLAMWTFFSMAIAISLLTYFSYGKHRLSDNLLNVTDLILVVGVSIAIVIWGDHTSRFNKFDLGCLTAVFIIVLFWLVSNNHLVTNLAVQGIMVISYFPVVKRMITHQKNTEDFTVWMVSLLAPIFSLFASSGILASIYAIRGITCAGTLLLLMLFFHLKNKEKKIGDNASHKKSVTNL